MTDITDRLKTALADRYAIQEELGAGGMATVYLAEDLKHHRKVAVKVLRSELAEIVGAERFLKEIEVTANLQHPHILPLFDSGEADSFLFYVMPYVEGESLREKLNREKQLSIKESVDITSAVASALDYAHRQDVIHRDIKPENILLHDGQTVVADFGIALAVSAAGAARLTATGLSLGTPHYMSPEQATADQNLTGRSDIYALGCVAYEMLAGDPPHRGGTAQAIIARIVTEEPRLLRTQRKAVPPHVESAIHRALEKLPADRFASAAAFAEALTNPVGDVASIGRPVVLGPKARGWHLGWPAALGAAFLLVIGALAGRVSAPAGNAGASLMRLELNASEAEPISFSTGPIPAVSPDGRLLVYVSGSGDGQHLVLRPLESQVMSRIAGTPGAGSPFFSPDGEWIGFFGTRGIRLVRLSGGAGAPEFVAEDASNFRGATWTPAGEIVFGRSGPVWQERAGPLWAVAADGSGEPRLVAAPDTARGVSGFWLPDALPDGRHVVATLLGATLGRWEGIAVVNLESGEWHVVLPPPAVGARYDPSGHLIYAGAGGTLQAVSFDARRLEVTGPPVTLAEDVHISSWGVPQFAISRQGTLVYIGQQPHQLALVDHNGTARPITGVSRIFHHPRFSPRGRRVVVDIAHEGSRDVWIQDLDQGTLTRLTFEGDANDPIWTPDGRRITYASARSGTRGIYETNADGSGTPESLLTVAGSNTTAGLWTPDGDRMIAIADVQSSGLDLMIVHGDDTSREPLVATPFDDAHPGLSRDGRWLAYVSDESGQSEVFVRSFVSPVGRGRTQVSIRGGTEPVWGPHGRKLYYRAPGGLEGPEFVVAEVEYDPTFRVVSRVRLFSAAQFVTAPPHANYDVAPDGSGFVMVRLERAPGFHVVLNWPAVVRAKVGN